MIDHRPDLAPVTAAGPHGFDPPPPRNALFHYADAAALAILIAVLIWIIWRNRKV